MHLLSSLSLSALLLAASVPAFAAESAAAAAALPAADAPALQVSAPPAAAATGPAAAGTVSPALPGAAALGGLADPQTLALLEQLRALDVTPQQAMGGVGAMLGLAQSQLGGEQYAQLAGAVPGLQLLGGAATLGALGPLGPLGALGGLLGNAAPQQPAQEAPVDSLDGLNQRFSALGMAPGLVGQFAPILLQFLGNQGVASALLQSLAGVWGVPGALAPATPVAVGG